MDKNISLNVTLTQEEVAAGQKDLENGIILKLTPGAANGGEFNDFEVVAHPVIEVAVSLLREEIGQATDLSLMNFLKTIVLLAGATPELSAKTLLEIVSAGLPWQMELLRSRIELGLPFDQSAFPGGLAITPNFNFSITTPEIHIPEQPAPVVNTVIRNELPSVEEETIDIQRDNSGFISSATKTRRRKQPASA